MSLLIGNMKTVVSFYPVGKKAGQVSKSRGGKFGVITTALPPQRGRRTYGKTGTGSSWSNTEATICWLKKKKRVCWLPVVKLLWKGILKI